VYRKNCEDIIGKRLELIVTVTVPALVVCYALILFGLYALVLVPGLSSKTTVWRCAVFGMCVYGVYNCVSLIMLPGYSVVVALVDSAWGAIALSIFGLVYIMCTES
jgi:uncharacterized membrane protein